MFSHRRFNPPHTLRATFRIVPLVATVLLLTGCWRVLMDPDTLRKTTPFGRGPETSGAEPAKQSDRVNGWPLFYTSPDAMSILWPMFVKREGANALFPLYESIRRTNGRSQLFLAMEVLGAEWGEAYRANHAFPVWFYKNDAERSCRRAALLPLFFFATSPRESTFAIPGLFFRHREKEARALNLLLLSGKFSNKKGHGNYLLPFWFYATDNALRRFYSIPYSSVSGPDEEWRSVFGPVYVSNRGGEWVSRSILWPFSHFWHSPRSRGHMLLPLYSWKHYAQGGTMFNSLLFNRRRSENKELLNFGGPLYFTSRDNESRYRAFLWPFYMDWVSPTSSGRLLIPLFADWRNDATRTIASPLFLRRWKADESQRLFLSPLWSRGKSGDEEWTNWAILLANFSKTPKRSDYSFLADSLHVRRDKTEGPKVSFGASVIKLIWADRYGFASPAIGHRNTLPGDGSVEAMRGAARAGREAGARSIRNPKRWTHILMALNWGRRLAGTDGGAPVVRSHFMFFPLLSHYEFVGNSRRTHESNVLFLLWNSRRETTGEAPGGPVATVRHRLLRKAFDYERVGSRTSVDAFPFVAIDADRATDTGRFSFLGPVVSRQRAGDQVRWRVLGIPLGERIE
ncbi:hypothetical protein JW916_00725 [Candidatus Sumerlaeota bacterium]|nr:hypothetical protein [Candidatus Sumerlaeota bacterium]